MFSGGALSRFTVFAIGIMPYISASIIIQLVQIFPKLKGAEEGGRAGGAKLRIPVMVRFAGDVPELWYSGDVVPPAGFGGNWSDRVLFDRQWLPW